MFWQTSTAMRSPASRARLKSIATTMVRRRSLKRPLAVAAALERGARAATSRSGKRVGEGRVAVGRAEPLGEGVVLEAQAEGAEVDERDADADGAQELFVDRLDGHGYSTTRPRRALELGDDVVDVRALEPVVGEGPASMSLEPLEVRPSDGEVAVHRADLLVGVGGGAAEQGGDELGLVVDDARHVDASKYGPRSSSSSSRS
jgi:hypothetical protein